MKYKELKAYVESLEKTKDAEVMISKEVLVTIAKEALTYRKKNALNKRTNTTNTKENK